MLERFQMQDAQIAKTPLDSSLPLQKWKDSDNGDRPADKMLYQQIIGSLTHLAIVSRPDIIFDVVKLLHYSTDPSSQHLEAARHNLRYLKGTRTISIHYGIAQ